MAEPLDCRADRARDGGRRAGGGTLAARHRGRASRAEPRSGAVLVGTAQRRRHRDDRRRRPGATPVAPCEPRPITRSAPRAPRSRRSSGARRHPRCRSSRSRRSASSRRTSRSTWPTVERDRARRRDHPRRRHPARAAGERVPQHRDAGVGRRARGAHPGQGRPQGHRDGHGRVAFTAPHVSIFVDVDATPHHGVRQAAQGLAATSRASRSRRC